LRNPRFFLLLSIAFFVHIDRVPGQSVRETPLLPRQEELIQRRYTKADGLPVNALASLAFGPDSALYVATYDGLARFNGFRFQVINNSNTPGLDAERFAFIETLSQQTLLACTEDGRFYLVERNRARRIQFPGDPEHVTFTLGTGWRDSVLTFTSRTSLFTVPFNRSSNAELRFNAQADSLINVSVIGPAQYWITARSGLFFLDNGTVKHFIGWSRLPSLQTFFPIEVRALPNGDYGAFSMGVVFTIDEVSGAPKHSFRFADATGRVEHGRALLSGPGGGIIARTLHADYYLSSRLSLDSMHTPKPYVDRSFFNKNHDYWAGKPLHAGFHAVYWGETLLYQGKNPFQVKTLLAGPQSDLWIATASDGLLRFSRNPFGSISAKHGLPGQNLYSIRAMNNGTIFAAALDAGPLLIQKQSVISWTSLPGGILARSVLNLRDGALLSGHYSSILYITKGTGTWTMPDGIVPFVEAGGNSTEALYEAPDGTVWIGTRTRLGRRRPGASAFEEVRDAGGRTITRVRNILETPEGDLLFLTAGNGLLIAKKNGLPERFMAALPQLDHIRDVWFRSEKEWWGASETDGLVRFSPADTTSVFTVSIPDGLPDNTFHRLIPDNSGRLWATSNKGLVCFLPENLDRYQQRIEPLRFAWFGAEDGLTDAEFNGGTSDAGFTAKDGILWFPNQKGLVFFNPDSVIAWRNAAKLQLKPSFIETKDRKVFDSGRAFALEADERNVVFHFDAVNLSASRAAAFEYRIDSKEWLPLGEQTFFPLANLRAGMYRITVREKGNFWNPSVLEASISIVPLFYETRLFKSLAIITLLLSMAGAFQSARLYNRRREKRLQQLIDTRTADLRQQRQQTEEALQTVREQAGRLEEFNRYRTDLFLGFTHELRTPLALITGPLEHLSQVSANLSSENASIQLGIVRRNAVELQKLINRILFLMRVSDRESADASERVDLDEVIASVTAPFRDRTLYSSHVFHLDCAQQLGTTRSEKASLELILSNLISNAFKYGNGTVSLRAERHNETVLFQVHNGGAPIPEKDIPRLFEPFFRGEQHESISGSGMGLPIVQRLVSRLGGSINVTSTFSEGTSFTVALPAPVVEQPDAGPPSANTAPAIATGALRSSQHRLLIVDDNADFRTLLKHALEPVYQLSFAADGIEASTLFAETPFDLIISDVMMPGLDGFGLAESVRATGAGRNVPFIFLTANDRPEALARGLALGADAYLTKPVSLELLKAHIQALLLRHVELNQNKQNDAPADPIIEKVNELIIRHLGNPDLSVEMIATQLNMSRPTLFRAWKKSNLPPVSEYIISQRIRFVLELVKTGNHSISQAAQTCGFNDPAYFSRVFRKMYGMAPGEWIKSQRAHS
jgi:signal transduction histidine kinase/CheY-like chemotaxis protein